MSRDLPNVILLPPGGPSLLAALVALDPKAGARARVVSDLAEAVALAARLAPRGSTVLFSPASPSYGVFKNFEERGDMFRMLVQGL